MAHVPPPTRQDAALARKHLQDSIVFNARHVADHEQALKKTTNKASKKYHKAHIKGHFKEAKQAAKKLKGDYLYSRITH